MMVTCFNCGCTITMCASEGPLYRCPMCGHQYAQPKTIYIADDDRTRNALKEIMDEESRK